MGTLFDPADRDRILQRIGRLTPKRKPAWGRMTARRMVVHAADQLRLALGDLSAAPKNSPARFFPLKQLLIFWLPLPKNVPTAPELLKGKPGDWDQDLDTLRALVHRFAAQTSRRRWPPHPLFGSLSRRAWGVLAYRHLDHHLCQFGV